MTIPEVEKKLIELIHRRPFIPFVVETLDGRSIEVPHPSLSINEVCAGFIDAERGFVDIDYKDVHTIRFLVPAEAP